VREICTLRAMRRELETWPRENCEPSEQSKELDWKPSPYSARASSRPYRGHFTWFGGWVELPASYWYTTERS
jgi:hypothetical protein